MKALDQLTDKLPPQNLEAEQSVLGAVMIDSEALPKAIEILNEEDFYKESHRRIFRAASELFSKGEAVDIVTVTDLLRRNGDIDTVGGVPYLSQIINSIPTAANVRYHAKIVREKALLRSLLRTATQITSKVYEDSLDADEMVDYAEKMIFDIADKRTKTSFYDMKGIIKDTFKMIQTLYEKKDSITGVPTGYKDIDALTSGFQPGDLIIIGARPGMGKTSFALNIAQYVAIENKEPVAIFSLEMSKEQLAMRMLCAESMVDSSRVRKGFISKEDWPKLTNAGGRLAEAPLFIDDSAAISVLEVRAKARRLKMEHGGLSMVIVDYLQLMRGRGNFERREQEISDISRSLKELAKDLRVPVVALSQLNRAVENRGDRRPTMADLRESGAIEQDADVIMFLYRDEVYNKNNSSSKGKAEVIIAKQRNGPTDVVNLTFLSDATRFVDFAGVTYESEEEVY